MRPGELAVDLAPRPYPTLAKALPLGDPGVAAAPAPRRARRGARGWPRPRRAKASPPPTCSRASPSPGLLGLRGRARQPVRHLRLAGLGRDAGAQLGRLRSRQRPGPPARHRSRGPETLAVYEQTVLRALEETENALVAYREQQRRLVLLADQARESGRAASIARVRYREGLADFLALLDAERTELQAQEAVAQAEAGVFTGVVGIYKSLGGIPR